MPHSKPMVTAALFAAALFLSCGGKRLPVEEFAPIVRSHPTPADTQFNLGMALTILEREDQAVERFREAVRLNPADTEAWFHLGVDLSIMEREVEAAEAFQTAFRDPPKVTQHFKLGLAYFTVKRYEDAIREFREAIAAHEPHPVTTYIKMGVAYSALGIHREALAAFSCAIRLNPDVALKYYNAYLLAGISLRALGRNGEAVDALRRAIEVRPDVAFSYYNLGAAHSDMGNTAGAGEQYIALKSLDENMAKDLASYIRGTKSK